MKWVIIGFLTTASFMERKGIAKFIKQLWRRFNDRKTPNL